MPPNTEELYKIEEEENDSNKSRKNVKNSSQFHCLLN